MYELVKFYSIKLVTYRLLGKNNFITYDLKKKKKTRISCSVQHIILKQWNC